jgi:hypothetical protein
MELLYLRLRAMRRTELTLIKAMCTEEVIVATRAGRPGGL